MASIKKRPNGKWRARYRDGAGREHASHFDRKADAQAWLDRETASLVRGDHVDPAVRKTTIGTFAEQLLAGKADRNNRSWYKTHVGYVERDWTLANGETLAWKHSPAAGLQHADVQAWVNAMVAAGHGADTVRGAYRVLHEIVKLAQRSRALSWDPCAGVVLPKVVRREMLFLDPKQIVMLADTVDAGWPGHGYGLLVRFAAYSGCRAGEIGALRVKHVDVMRARVQIQFSLKSHGAVEAPKAGSYRWVGLPRQLAGEVAIWIAGKDRDEFVWTGERGGPLNHKWWYQDRFKPTVEKLSAADRPTDKRLPTLADADESGDRTLRFHDLRHTCVALLIAKGAQQYEVMKHLGHTNIQTTINTYGHLFPEVQERIVAALDKTWDEAMAWPVNLRPA
jgi:integrase